MRFFVGTSGYAYKAWKGTFYPEKLPQKDMLRYYGQQFNAVEINNTFYRMPRESVLLNWAEDVPPEFSFVLKASRRISHFSRLNPDPDILDYVFRTATVLAERLGPTLFQLPPTFKKDVAVLRAFLDRLPSRWRAAFEFRHASWFDDEVYTTLRAHDAALVAAETDQSNDVPLVPTTTWGYLRLRRQAYTDDELATWITRIRDQGWSEAFVFFKHEESGTGPELAQKFNAVAERS